MSWSSPLNGNSLSLFKHESAAELLHFLLLMQRGGQQICAGIKAGCQHHYNNWPAQLL